MLSGAKIKKGLCCIGIRVFELLQHASDHAFELGQRMLFKHPDQKQELFPEFVYKCALTVTWVTQMPGLPYVVPYWCTCICTVIFWYNPERGDPKKALRSAA